MKKNSKCRISPLIIMSIFLMTINSCDKDDGNDDLADVESPVVIYEIEDYGYTYAVCKGTFEHNNDTSLLLNQLYYSDITIEPTVTNGNRPRISADGDGYIIIIKDTLGQIDFECVMIELENNTTYHIRCAYTRNRIDTLYSNSVSFTTKLFEINSLEFNSELTYSQINDIDNNTYNTIQIGTQTWMAENLKTTKFNNGTSIPFSINSVEFSTTTNPAYINFENNEVISEQLGKLYNWYVIEEENVCPAGWHVASASDWDVLDEYVIQNYECSGKALASKAGWMEAFWYDCNIGNDFAPNDSTGFSAVAAGAFSDDVFGGFGHAGVWWSPNDENGNYLPSSRYLTRDNSNLGVNGIEDKNKGYSVRCVKN